MTRKNFEKIDFLRKLRSDRDDTTNLRKNFNRKNYYIRC